MARVHLRDRRSGRDLREVVGAAVSTSRAQREVVERNGTTMEFGLTVADGLALLKRANKVQLWIKVDRDDSLLLPYTKRQLATFLKQQDLDDPLPCVLFSDPDGVRSLGVGCPSALHRITGERV